MTRPFSTVGLFEIRALMVWGWPRCLCRLLKFNNTEYLRVGGRRNTPRIPDWQKAAFNKWLPQYYSSLLVWYHWHTYRCLWEAFVFTICCCSTWYSRPYSQLWYANSCQWFQYPAFQIISVTVSATQELLLHNKQMLWRNRLHATFVHI